MYQVSSRRRASKVSELHVARLGLNDGAQLWISFKLFSKETYFITHIRDQKYNLVLRLLTCIQKVCKKTEIHAKIWPYTKDSNLHSKGMCKKKQKFTQTKQSINGCSHDLLL